jgi:hypothetical protein
LRKYIITLFNNAFQPGSEMDARIQSIKRSRWENGHQSKSYDKEVKAALKFETK